MILGRRKFLVLTTGLAAGAAMAKAMPVQLNQEQFSLGFLPAGKTGKLYDAAVIRSDDIIAGSAQITISGHLEEAFEAVSLDVLFGSDASYPFHAWVANRSSGAPDGTAISFRVSLKHTTGLKMLLNIDGMKHDLVLDESWYGPRLRRGSYVLALDTKTKSPDWSGVVAQINSSTNLDLAERCGSELLPMKLPHLLISVEAA